MEGLSFISVLVGVLALSLGALYLYFKHRFNYWRDRGVLQLKPSFPFGNCGDLVLMRKSFGETFSEHYKLFAGNAFGGVYMVQRPHLVIRDPDIIKNIVVKDFDHFHDRGFDFDEKIDPLSGNLFMLTGLKWKELRTKLSPTFTSGKMKMMFPTLVDCGVELQEYLQNFADKDDMLEMRDVLAKFSTDVIASCAFGIQCNCLKNPDAEFRQWGKRALEISFEVILRNLMYMILPSVAMALKISNTPNDVTNFFRTMVNETVNFRETHSVERKDFLQLLIKLKNKESLELDTLPTQQNESKYSEFSKQ
jgi:cytochrome P450 family 6